MPDFDEHTALVVVDVQNDFADPRGALYVEGGEDIVPVVDRLIEAAEAAGALVVYTQDWHPPRTVHFEALGGPWPPHGVAGSWGAALHPGLTVRGPIIKKGTGGENGYSAFTVRDPVTRETASTGLEAMLRERGIDRVVVVGLATDWCVKETALDARRAGFAVSVVTRATRAVNRQPGDEERALSQLQDAGVTLL